MTGGEAEKSPSVAGWSGIAGFEAPGRCVSWIVLSTTLVALAGCGPRAYPLYSNPERPRGPDEVATLSGPIASVDERPVSDKGTIFHVRPGCHVVRLLTRIGEMNLEGTAAWSATLPPLVYVFWTKAGHWYGIGRSLSNSSTMVGTVSLTAFDRDPQGGMRDIAPARTAAEIADCRP